MEPPFWYYPVRQSLGGVLLLSGDADGAEQAFRGALRQSPNNSWVLLGLREALLAQGDQAGADTVNARLARGWTGERGPFALKRLNIARRGKPAGGGPQVLDRLVLGRHAPSQPGIAAVVATRYTVIVGKRGE